MFAGIYSSFLLEVITKFVCTLLMIEVAFLGLPIENLFGKLTITCVAEMCVLEI